MSVIVLSFCWAAESKVDNDKSNKLASAASRQATVNERFSQRNFFMTFLSFLLRNFGERHRRAPASFTQISGFHKSHNFQSLFRLHGGHAGLKELHDLD